jgi:peroxiredoxin
MQTWIWVALCLVSGLSFAAEPAEPVMDAAAQKLLKRTAEHYKGFTTFQTNLFAHLHVKSKEGEQTQDTSATLTVKKPDQLAFHTLGDDPGTAALLNGSTMTLMVKKLKQYIAKKQPMDFDKLLERPDLSMMSGGAMAFLAPLMTSNPYEQLIKDASLVKITGTGELDGVACTKVRVEREPMAVVLWIANGEAPEIKRVSPDIMALSKQQTSDPNELPEIADFNFDLLNQKYNPPLPADAFAMSVPAGFRRVKHFHEGDEEEEPPHPLLGKPAPELKLELLDGGKLDLASHKGKNVVVLDFWATWCGPCRKGLPGVIKATSQYKGKGVEFYAVNLREDADAVKKFLAKEELAMPVALDKDGKASEPFQFQGIPFTVVIDKQGVIQAVHAGFDPDNEQLLDEELATLTAGKPLVQEKAATAKQEKQ